MLFTLIFLVVLFSPWFVSPRTISIMSIVSFRDDTNRGKITHLARVFFTRAIHYYLSLHINLRSTMPREGCERLGA